MILHLTLVQSEKALNRAAETLDHFPSLSQVIELCDYFQKISDAAKGVVSKKSRIIDKPCCSCMGDGLLFLYDENGSHYIFSCDKCKNGDIQREISGRDAPHVNVGIKLGYIKREGPKPLPEFNQETATKESR